MAKFSVIGSCVSRDVLSFISDVRVGQYVARTSIVSMVSEPSSWVDTRPFAFKSTPHPWHDSVLRDDIHKAHNVKIQLMKGDHVLIDFIEERCGLIEVEPSKYVTYSDIIRKLTDYSHTSRYPFIPVFSEKGFSLWRKSLSLFSERIKNLIPDEKIILHRATYASAEHQANKWLEKMHDCFLDVFSRAQVVQASPKNLVSNDFHKWGKAPYHYCDEYYDEIARNVCEIADITYIRNEKITFNT